MAEEQSTNEEWNEVDVKASEEENKVDYEVEDEVVEEKAIPLVQAKEEVVEKVEEVPKELEGIETKGAQKRIKQLVKQRKERDEQLAQLIKTNEQLNNRLQNTEHQFNTVSQLNLTASEKQITDKLELARNVYKSAHEEGDSTKILQAQEFLNEAQNDLKSLSAASLAIDSQLKEEGFTPTDPDYYIEIDRRIKETFPHKFSGEVRKQEATSQPAQVVAGASRSSPGSSKKVKLTKEDVRLAGKWNVPLEKYAQEKLKADQANGEYTTINTQRGR